MLIIDSIERLQVRSGERLRAKDLKPILEMLRTSEVLRDREERRGSPSRVTYRFIDLIMVLIWMEVKKTTLQGVVTDLEDHGGQLRLAALGLRRGRDGKYPCPSDTTLCEFRKDVLPKFAEDLRREIAQSYLDSLLEPRFCTCDSTPLEASRYSRRCVYSPHYEIRMDKLHMIMVNGAPVVYRLTGGNDGDNPQLLDMLSSLKDESPSLYGAFMTDGAYHSFETYSSVFMKTGKVMSTNQGVDAVFHEEATWDRVVDRYNRMWKNRDFRPDAKPMEILRYLIRNGESDLAGRFLHNLDHCRGRAAKAALARKRHLCETVHFDAKRWVRLDVRGVHKDSVDSVIAMRFITVQLLCLSFVSLDH